MSLISDLADLIGPNNIQSQADHGAKHSVDWSKLNPQAPVAVAYPSSTNDVSKLLEYCNSHNIPVVTQGGLTGLSGGATPCVGELAISLEKLSGIIELDVDSQCIIVKAGTPLQVIQEAAANAGFCLPLDLGARGSCTIGGNIATNAGGNQVIRYGMTRALVLGLEAVRANGEVVRSMNKMLKNNSGYDLKQLFIGSEGTLGIVTEAALRLYPQANNKLSLMCALSSFEQVSSLLQALQRCTGGVSAYEVMWRSYVDYALKEMPELKDPFQQRHAFYALVEIENGETFSEAIQLLLHEKMQQAQINDVVIAQSIDQQQSFWAIRDAVSTLLPTMQGLANFDIGIPIKHMATFINEVEHKLTQEFPDISIQVFGHVGDGNLHIFAHRGNDEEVPLIFKSVYAIAEKYDGAVTAEHGVGMHKRNYLQFSRNSEEIALMRLLKESLDPNNILNRGRVLPPL